MRVALVVRADTLDANEGIGVAGKVVRDGPDEAVALRQIVAQNDRSNDLRLVGIATQKLNVHTAELRPVIGHVPRDGAGLAGLALRGGIRIPDINIAGLGGSEAGSSKCGKENGGIHSSGEGTSVVVCLGPVPSLLYNTVVVKVTTAHSIHFRPSKIAL